MGNLPETRIAIVSKNFRNHRLYLEPAGENVIDIEIVRTDGSPLDLIPHQTRLAIDFGRLEFGAREDEQLGVTLADWLVAREPQRIVLTRRTAATIGKGDRIALRIPLPPLVERFRKPYGTVLLTLERNGEIVATAEFEQSVVTDYSEPPATPPVLVAWCGQVKPVLALNRAQSLDLMIVNARLNRRGDPKILVSLERGGLPARIRLSFPALPQSDGTLATLTDRQGLDRIVPETGAVGRAWTADDRPESWEIATDAANATVFEAEGALRIALRDVTPTRTGNFALCVTLLDLPGYARATYSLPFDVADADAPEIAELCVDPPGVTAPRTVTVGWRLTGEKPCHLILTACSAGSTRTLLSGPAASPGCVAFALSATTTFELTASRNGRSVSRSVTAFVAQPRERLKTIKITPPPAVAPPKILDGDGRFTSLLIDLNAAVHRVNGFIGEFDSGITDFIRCAMFPDEVAEFIIEYANNGGVHESALTPRGRYAFISFGQISIGMNKYIRTQRENLKKLAKDILEIKKTFIELGADVASTPQFGANVSYSMFDHKMRQIIKTDRRDYLDYYHLYTKNNIKTEEWGKMSDLDKRRWCVNTIARKRMIDKFQEIIDKAVEMNQHISSNYKSGFNKIVIKLDWLGAESQYIIYPDGKVDANDQLLRQ